ncbi:MAG: succinate dehydrogenase [Rhodospirillales bacterium]|jgi:fumarate reductase subunit C|nr:succinate dehydrogenase [Rhodospirillales bacterium]HJO97512.1 succinate dehydrogenase [Rhodospirillales bacterium]
MIGVRLYLAQRLSALILAPLVAGHLAVIFYAVQGGLDGAEILSRTQGSVGFALFYGLFVIAVSVHGAIGLRVVVHEHLKLAGRTLDGFTLATGAVLLGLGLRACVAVVG